MNLAIKPLEYYKFRSSHPDLEIKNLSDKYGYDNRLSHPPYCRTFLEESTILQFQKEVIENIAFGKELIDIILDEQRQVEKAGFSKYYINYKLLLRWERISGIEQHIPESERNFWRDLKRQ